MTNRQDLHLECIDCHLPFSFTAGEQDFFADKGLKNIPKRCRSCQAEKRKRFSQVAPTPGISPDPVGIVTWVQCCECGKLTHVPFVPTQGRPVFCRMCFLAQSGNEGRTPVEEPRRK